MSVFIQKDLLVLFSGNVLFLFRLLLKTEEPDKNLENMYRLFFHFCLYCCHVCMYYNVSCTLWIHYTLEKLEISFCFYKLVHSLVLVCLSSWNLSLLETIYCNNDFFSSLYLLKTLYIYMHIYIYTVTHFMEESQIYLFISVCLTFCLS